MDEPLTLELEADRLRPGARVGGVVRWQLAAAPMTGELRLRWDTAGKGAAEHEVVGTTDLAMLPQLPRAPDGYPFRGGAAAGTAGPLAARDARRFSFTLPLTPFTFTGALISLTWSIEATLDEHRARKVIVVGPRARAVELGGASLAEPRRSRRSRRR